MIRTERLVLRMARESDLDALYAMFSDPEAMRYWSTAPHRSREETEATLAHLIAGEKDLGPERVIVRDGEVIGRIGLWRRWEVGFILHPAAWGRGYALEALTAICAAAFARHPEMDGIDADIDPRNSGSAKVLERAGFRVTGEAQNTFLIDGAWVHSRYYRLDRAPAG